MVIKDNERTKIDRENKRRLIVPEDYQKEKVLSELRNESLSVICLAAMYAKNFEAMGFDVTRGLINAQQNVGYLEAAYKKGVDDTIARYRDKGVTINENKGKNS